MITLKPGESGYFSKPAQILDPHLFDGDHLKPDVRSLLTQDLMHYLGIYFNNPDRWIMVWLAGSGVSYQWAAARGNGDLDVLFGIDYDKFVEENRIYQWATREEIAEQIDAELKAYVWPLTANTYINGQYYEVTFFANDNVEANPDSITNIHPYAAYNLTTDEWTTKPPKLPENPRSLYPVEFERAADANLEAAQALVNRYNAVSEGTGVNALTHRRLVGAQVKNLFDTIHLGRKNAFSMHGEGYGDYYNYAWQRAKQDGIVNALNEIINKEH